MDVFCMVFLGFVALVTGGTAAYLLICSLRLVSRDESVQEYCLAVAGVMILACMCVASVKAFMYYDSLLTTATQPAEAQEVSK